MVRRFSIILGGCLLASAAAAAPAKPPAEALPGVRVQAPVTTAKPTAKPAKKVAKKPTKKKQVAAKGRGKGKVKTGRAAADPEGLAYVDQNQIAIDHLANAESKSTLDLLVSYKETVREGDLETAGVLLRLLARETPSHSLVTTVNDLLGIALNTEDTEILIQITKAARADAFAKDADPKTSAASAAPSVSARIQAAHATAESAPRSAGLSAMSAYKTAVLGSNAEAAALALAAVARRPLDEALVAKANDLLELTSAMSADKIVAQAASGL